MPEQDTNIEAIPALAFLKAIFKSTPDPKDRKLVETIVGVRALLAQRTDKDQAFEVDPDNIGYLKRTLDGVSVYVPFNLVSVFPGRDYLEDMVSTAKGIRMEETHSICVSGSATFLGKSVPISDLDFCEYFPSPVGLLPRQIAARLGASLDRLLVRVNWCGSRMIAPFSDLENVLSQKANGDVTYVKLDFIWEVPKFGLMPTTTMILNVAEDMSGDALGRTFVHQEAVISASGPPRSLFATSEIARYLEFLEEEVSKYALSGAVAGSSDSLKALKRALSLLLLIGADQEPELRDELEGLIEELSGPAVAGIVMEKRLSELTDLAVDVDAAISDSLKAEIGKLKSDFQDHMLQSEERDQVLQVTSQAAEGLKHLISGLFSVAKNGRH